MFSFKDVQEDAGNNNQYIKPGIHEVTIKEIYYQPIGPNVKEGQKPENVSIEKGVFVLESKDGEVFNYDVLAPTGTEEEKAEKAGKMMKRLLHFLSKTGKTSEIDTIKAKLQTLNVTTFKALIEALAKVFTKKQLRMKFGTDDTRKYTRVPNFFSGWAECIDVNPTQLKFDESKESLLAKDSSKVENTNIATDSDDLPWA